MEQEKKEGRFHLPPWVGDVAMKVLPWALMGIIGASLGLYADNIANKRDISNNTWRVGQNESRLERMEARLDRMETHLSNQQKEDEEFREEVLERLRRLLTLKR